MTDTRQVLEEAFKVIHPRELGNGYDQWEEMLIRFTRFLDAEAWTDAALMLPSQRAKSSALRKAWANVSEKLALHIRFMRDDVDYSAEIALAIAQAALRAKEAGDV